MAQPAGSPAEAPAQSRAQARERAAAAERAAADGESAALTRPPVAGELAYESTVTAPTEWVPYKYTTAEIQIHASRRGLGIASVVCGMLGVVSGIFMIWGVPLSVAAVLLALLARFIERGSATRWRVGLGSGIVGILLGALWLIVITQILPGYYS